MNITLSNFEIDHWCRKFGRTVKILYCLGCARMFGECVHSGWDGSIEYARYNWRGEEWIIPTGPVDKENEE